MAVKPTQFKLPHKFSLMEQGSISLQLDHNFCLAACCAWQMLTSVERRSPVVSRIAPTTPGVMNATALQDTDSTQTGVAAMVMFLPSVQAWTALTFK